MRPVGSDTSRPWARRLLIGHILGDERISSCIKELENGNPGMCHETKGEVTTTTKGHHAADHMLADSLKNSIDQRVPGRINRTTKKDSRIDRQKSRK